MPLSGMNRAVGMATARATVTTQTTNMKALWKSLLASCRSPCPMAMVMRLPAVATMPTSVIDKYDGMAESSSQTP